MIYAKEKFKSWCEISMQLLFEINKQFITVFSTEESYLEYFFPKTFFFTQIFLNLLKVKI